jgi:hypothetical protein
MVYMQPSNLVSPVSLILFQKLATGSYALFNFSDIAYNQLELVKVLLDITN